MKRRLFSTACLSALFLMDAAAQVITIPEAKIKVGDNMEWKEPACDDSSWRGIKTYIPWTGQGVNQANGYAWYRMKVVIPKSMLENSSMKDSLVFYIAKVDDTDETYLNGHLIGKMGAAPKEAGGPIEETAWNYYRNYKVAADSKLIKWDEENTIAVRVYNGEGGAGIFGDTVKVFMPDILDGFEMAYKQNAFAPKASCAIVLKNHFRTNQKGRLKITATDTETGETIYSYDRKITLGALKKRDFNISYAKDHCVKVDVSYTDAWSGKEVAKSFVPKYILTPAAPAAPRYNGALVYGARPGSPVIFKIAMSGEKPIKYSVRNMPEGLRLDAERGILSGSLPHRGDYTMTFVGENSKGKTEQEFTLKIGDRIALTPPMGWNSWNCWGLSVSQEKVMSSAQAMIDKGLNDYGYSYVNVDDAWEAAERNPDGTLDANDKFPDMKALGDWLHGNGFKFGIYSSPGDRTCGGNLGSLGYEKEDAETFNKWGIDYLKYDWCGYSREYDKSRDRSIGVHIYPYLKMSKWLREQPRDIFYSLCQYGMAEVWKWGPYVDANSWRTTGDILDTWESLHEIGFTQDGLFPFAAPGHWNDPDMLIVGKVGWSSSLRDSRLTPDEQYTHITLWTLLAANMLIGCDVSQMDDFTLGLLCNNEVNAVNQDVLGRQAKREVVDGDIQVWKRPLHDGSHAIGIFNLGDGDVTVDLAGYFNRLGIEELKTVRDLWRQKDLAPGDTKYFIPSHGVKYIKVRY